MFSFDRSSSFNGTIPWPLRLPQFTPERSFPQTLFHDFHVASAATQLARLRHNATLMYANGEVFFMGSACGLPSDIIPRIYG